MEVVPSANESTRQGKTSQKLERDPVIDDGGNGEEASIERHGSVRGRNGTSSKGDSLFVPNVHERITMCFIRPMGLTNDWVIQTQTVPISTVVQFG